MSTPTSSTLPSSTPSPAPSPSPSRLLQAESRAFLHSCAGRVRKSAPMVECFHSLPCPLTLPHTSTFPPRRFSSPPFQPQRVLRLQRPGYAMGRKNQQPGQFAIASQRPACSTSTSGHTASTAGDLMEKRSRSSNSLMKEKHIVLVLGGSGYLGLHILHHLHQQQQYQLAFTYCSRPPPPSLLLFLPDVRAFHVDLQSGQGLHDVAKDLGPPWVVINCAAISIPRECELNPSIAMAVNIPVALVHWLSSFADIHPLLIHLSTDQVYEGIKSYYKEEEEAKPINMYGKSKLEGEQLIMKNWCNYAILRSSIIYGPQPVVPVQKSLPIQVESPLVD